MRRSRTAPILVYIPADYVHYVHFPVRFLLGTDRAIDSSGIRQRKRLAEERDTLTRYYWPSQAGRDWKRRISETRGASESERTYATSEFECEEIVTRM